MHGLACIGVRLDAIVSQAPPVPDITLATAHDITVHRPTRTRYCFAIKSRRVFHSRPYRGELPKAFTRDPSSPESLFHKAFIHFPGTGGGCDRRRRGKRKFCVSATPMTASRGSGRAGGDLASRPARSVVHGQSARSPGRSARPSHVHRGPGRCPAGRVATGRMFGATAARPVLLARPPSVVRHTRLAEWYTSHAAGGSLTHADGGGQAPRKAAARLTRRAAA